MRLIIVILVLGLLITPSLALPTDEGPIVITVQEKWSKTICNGDGCRGLYLFSTTDGDVYSIEDCTPHLVFDAANRYAMIQSGQSYKIWLFGIRNGFMSWYQNAYRIESI